MSPEELGVRMGWCVCVGGGKLGASILNLSTPQLYIDLATEKGFRINVN